MVSEIIEGVRIPASLRSETVRTFSPEFGYSLRYTNSLVSAPTCGVTPISEVWRVVRRVSPPHDLMSVGYLEIRIRLAVPAADSWEVCQGVSESTFAELGRMVDITNPSLVSALRSVFSEVVQQGKPACDWLSIERLIFSATFDWNGRLESAVIKIDDPACCDLMVHYDPTQSTEGVVKALLGVLGLCDDTAEDGKEVVGDALPDAPMVDGVD